MKKDEVTAETIEEIVAPRQVDELLQATLQDLILNNPPDVLVSEFIEDFILIDRAETPEILALFEMPSENLVEVLRGIMTQGYQTQIQALDAHGFQFLENLKAKLKTQMTALAAENG